MHLEKYFGSLTLLLLITLTIPNTVLSKNLKAATSKCHLLSDPNAPLWRSDLMEEILDQFNGQTVQGATDTLKNVYIPDSVSQCVASFHFQVNDIIRIAFDNDCYGTLKDILPKFTILAPNLEVSTKFKEVVTQFSSMTKLNGENAIELLGDFFNWASALPNDYYSPICSTLKNKANFCLKKKILPLLEELFKTPCCKDLRDSLNFNIIFPHFFWRIEDLFCGQQTVVNPEDNSVTNLTCGYSLVQTFFNFKFINNIFYFLQIPNDQACLATTGAKFKTTKKKQYYYDYPLGCCSTYLDQLMQLLKQVPEVIKYITADAFELNKCVDPLTLPFVQENLLQIPGQAGSLLKQILSSTCVHIPNMFADNCSYTSQCEAVKTIPTL